MSYTDMAADNVSPSYRPPLLTEAESYRYADIAKVVPAKRVRHDTVLASLDVVSLVGAAVSATTFAEAMKFFAEGKSLEQGAGFLMLTALASVIFALTLNPKLIQSFTKGR